MHKEVFTPPFSAKPTYDMIPDSPLEPSGHSPQSPHLDSDGKDAEYVVARRERLTPVQRFFVLLTVCSLALFVLMPMWNAVMLLSSTPHSYLFGIWPQMAFIAILLALVCSFWIGIRVFLQTAKPEVQTWQTTVMIANVVLVILGVTFMLFGHGLFELAKNVGKDLEYNCRDIEKTAALWRESEILYALRAQPDCVSQTSVRLCKGFHDNEMVDVLSAMEVDFKCSTFCNEPDMPVVARTLFSEAGYASSCQMMVARNLHFYIEDLGYQTYIQGCVLVLASVIMGFLKLLNFCTPHQPLQKAFAHFGKEQAADYGAIDS